MRLGHFEKAFFSLVTILAGAAGTMAQVSATATMTAQQISPGDYQYTIDLTNTGSAGIETFWFGWLPGYDCLKSMPTVTTTPTNWTTYIESGYYGGYSIEFYDSGTSSPLGSGKSSTQFQFDSPDAPSTLMGNDPVYGYYPETFSYVYQGAAEASAAGVIPSIQITTVVPEPASLAMLGLSAFACIGRRKRIIH